MARWLEPVTILWVLALGLGGLGAGLALSIEARPQRLDVFGSWAIPVIATLFAVSEVLVVHLHFRRGSHTFSMVEAPLALGLWVLGPEELYAAALLGVGAALTLARRQPPLKLAFNLGKMAVETTLAVAVFEAVAGSSVTGPRSWTAALAAAVITSAFGAVVVTTAIRDRRRSASSGSARLRGLRDRR